MSGNAVLESDGYATTTDVADLGSNAVTSARFGADGGLTLEGVEGLHTEGSVYRPRAQARYYSR